MSVATKRDYQAEMAKRIEEAIPEWDFIPAALAAELVRDLSASDPDLLAGWAEVNIVAILTARIRDLVRGRRLQQRADVRRGAFADAAAQAATGDLSGLAAFDVVYEIDVEHTRRHVRDMTGADHRYVADRYDESSNRSKLLAEFHRAVAKKVGSKKTADVFKDEQQYLRLYHSIAGSESA